MKTTQENVIHLMHPVSGDVLTSEEWRKDMADWSVDPDCEDPAADLQRQYKTLLEVEKDEAGEWVEV